MARYRPPRKPGSRYITPEGETRLRKELDYLWRVKRPQVTRAVSEAAAQGDRSENAEYIYGKKQLAEIDRRLRYLQKRLDEVEVVSDVPGDSDRVFFGAWVELEDEQGDVVRYRIVGPDEIDTDLGWISVDAPVARALLNKTEGDEVVVQLPKGEASYIILRVCYQPFDD
jgi:transcription elongation factor GreB